MMFTMQSIIDYCTAQWFKVSFVSEEPHGVIYIYGTGLIPADPPDAPAYLSFKFFDVAPKAANACECGSEKAKLPTHSEWCPKAGTK